MLDFSGEVRFWSGSTSKSMSVSMVKRWRTNFLLPRVRVGADAENNRGNSFLFVHVTPTYLIMVQRNKVRTGTHLATG